MVEFEIRHKDLMGRIGKLRTPHGSIETPTIMPVVNPNLISIKAEEMKRYGAEMVITNAYIIYRKRDLREAAVKNGIHSLLRCEMPIMTDSGSYQLYEYRDVGVGNREILEFQQRIGSDVSVPLDIPTPPYAKKGRAKDDLEETLRRMEEARRIVKNGLLAGVVQGSTFIDLREESAKRVAEIGFDIYAIGGVVPLLESYTFDKLVDIIVASKRNLPLNAPVHLFGAGHPMIFPLAVALGCDFFDSAAYALYAKGKRYITSEGTRKVEDLEYLPCACPVCSSYSVREVKEEVDLLAAHNLWVTFEEMRRVKQSIVERNLWELCELRCRAFPSLLNGLKRMVKYSALIERYDPATKHPFFYLGESSAYRPEVLRYSNRLDRFTLSGDVLITTDFEVSPEEEEFDHVFFVKPPFGPYPAELSESYPVGQAEIPAEVDDEAKTVALQNVLKLLEINRDVKFVFRYDSSWEDHPLIEEIRKYAEVRERD
ncbi:MAG: tRNA guanosine(15) transglycosylase TgtA [Candidatus Methanospirareceae archaeon]